MPNSFPMEMISSVNTGHVQVLIHLGDSCRRNVALKIVGYICSPDAESKVKIVYPGFFEESSDLHSEKVRYAEDGCSRLRGFHVADILWWFFPFSEA